MNEDKNTKRTETFVFEFDNQEVFKKFWGEYCHLDKELNNGITWKGAAIGDRIRQENILLDLISRLYDMAAGNYSGKQMTEDTLKEAEDLLGI